MGRAFAQVDVFSSHPLKGNPVAVILDGEGLSTNQMQQLARWTNLSETTFVLRATDPDADYRLRIFTPGGELPFAGHPTLGSAHAWLENGGTPGRGDRVVQQCQAGLVAVLRGERMLSFAAPPTLRTGPIDDSEVDLIAAAFKIDRERIIDHQWVDNGPGWAVVRLSTAREVLDLEPDLTVIPQSMVGAIGAYPEGSEYQFEMRTFAPKIGVAEDPVCGSMNAGVGQWLTAGGTVPGSYRVSQGAALGREGSIEITADIEGTVWVGGATRTIIRGVIALDQ